ncbi:hypothetical protein JYK14_06725 [Siccirubricoccus sp. KC 17139]|uniref:Uncharacterized protein n=1 Tax=Siccirubricoccus soli TaxID=2899147 RepID=A0ABT1D1S8_9PROT|nr:hypothetical protein [Siccirubricoccus soli]MCO6415869.1 hypothetical protein [Siccirubricoccus soli]MCP2682001.1 hypothetical protein [Siccirubricoccus soli]
MRDALEQLLFHRYPGFYVGRHMPLTENFMAYGFTHGDGWFAIVDVLSGLAIQMMNRTGKRIIASQIKEKLGGLRFYVRRADEFVGGARALGERYSYRVSELSGRPGVLQVGDGHYCTLAPGERAGYHPVEPRDTPLLGVGEPGALDRLRAEYGAHVPGGIDVPDGWVDLVQEFIHEDVVFPAKRNGRQEMAQLASVGTDQDGALVIVWTGEPTLEQQGRAAFARAMASRIDPVSGATGPVDDAGVPEWAR